MGTGGSGAIRDTIRVPEACTAKLALRYQAPDGTLSMRVRVGTSPVEEPVTIQDITELIARYLQSDSNITIGDITTPISRYLEQAE